MYIGDMMIKSKGHYSDPLSFIYLYNLNTLFYFI